MTNDADRSPAREPFDAAPDDAAGMDRERARPSAGRDRRDKSGDENDGRPRTKMRTPGAITAEWMMRAAAHYIERYATSSGNLRRVLEAKVRRRARARGEAPDEHGEMIAATVARFVDLKLVDDERFAEAKLASLRRRGTSARMAAAKLSEKGVERDLIETALAADESDDRTAAEAYARRRRLGPYRLRDRRARRDRDVAAMVRAGFSYCDAAAAIDGERIAAPGFILPSGEEVSGDDDEKA